MKDREKELFRELRKQGFKGKKLLSAVRDAMEGNPPVVATVSVPVAVPVPKKRGRPKKT